MKIFAEYKPKIDYYTIFCETFSNIDFNTNINTKL